MGQAIYFSPLNPLRLRVLSEAGGVVAWRRVEIKEDCPRRPLLFQLDIKIAIIGGGPAGLRAAEVAAAGGAEVSVFEAKRSVGRKFLVAGRGGLNLTHSESSDRFVTRYTGSDQPTNLWASLLADFDSAALRRWAFELGIETFTATSGRVYPSEMKAAPLLRRWLIRLRGAGIQFAMGHKWVDLQRSGSGWRLVFECDGEDQFFEADAVILALGGGSWPETGSDGSWTACLERLGVEVRQLVPANCGWERAWPATVLQRAEGKSLKNITVRAGIKTVTGELLVTRYGLEGGTIYALGATLRNMSPAQLIIDFKPYHTAEQLVAKLGNCRRNFLSEAQTRWHLGDAAIAVIEAVNTAEEFSSALSTAHRVKACAVSLERPRPIAEAISSAGGVGWAELDSSLMLRRLPGVFVAGEMIDWEAPTGGYLMQGCFATGTRAGFGALARNRV